jgi:putative FmdB family regulatory protein
MKTLPLYEYRCLECGHRFEKIQNFSDEPQVECPKCKGPLMRPLTAPAFNFKGAGWYVNDYAGKSSAPAASTVSAEAVAPAPAKCESCPAAAKCDTASSTT